MFRLHLYLTEDLKTKLDIKAKVSGKPKAEVAREALAEGLKKTQPTRSGSAMALLKLAEIADNLPSDPNAPRDLSTNHDYYTWGGKKFSNE